MLIWRDLLRHVVLCCVVLCCVVLCCVVLVAFNGLHPKAVHLCQQERRRHQTTECAC